MSLQRNLITAAEFGYEPPSDAIGYDTLYPSWVNKKYVKESKALTSYNPKAAEKLLKSSHFTYKSGKLYDPKGHPVSVPLSCPNGWSDWVASLQVISNDLQAIGINAPVDSSHDWSTYWGPKRSTRELSGGFFWEPGAAGSTPYFYFYSYMSRASYFPVGQDALSSGLNNLSGWWSNSADKMLAKFRQTSNAKLQHSIIDKLTAIQLNTLPWIPTVHGALWYTYSTDHFTGWPDAKHYYALGPAFQYPDNLKVMTTIKPV